MSAYRRSWSIARRRSAPTREAVRLLLVALLEPQARSTCVGRTWRVYFDADPPHLLPHLFDRADVDKAVRLGFVRLAVTRGGLRLTRRGREVARTLAVEACAAEPALGEFARLSADASYGKAWSSPRPALHAVVLHRTAMTTGVP